MTAPGTTSAARADWPTRLVAPEVLRDLMERLLRAAGCPPDIAATAADVHLEADLCGHDIQGLDHMESLIADIRAGHIDPAGRPEIVAEGDAWAHIGGNNGLGHPAGILAAETAIAKAKGAGCAVVGIKDSADIFLLGHYGAMIARAGQVAMICTVVPPTVHPYGGTEAILGTNPLVLAVPTAGPNPVLLDMATSAVAMSRARQAAYHGTPLPEGVGVGPDGAPTTDAAAIHDGAVGPLADHRGFGLALCLGLMAGPLVGAATGKALDAWHGRAVPFLGFGHFFLAVDPAIFGSPDVFRAAVDVHLAEIRASRKASGVDAIRIPGERTYLTRERSLREGIRMFEEVWSRAAVMAAELGVEMPA